MTTRRTRWLGKGIGILMGIGLAGCASVPEAAAPGTLKARATDVVAEDREAFLDGRVTVEPTPRQREQITLAIARADTAIRDTLFTGILRRMQSAGEINWRDRDRKIPEPNRADPTGWILERFGAEGNFRADQVSIRVYKTWWGGTNTTTVGSTRACVWDTGDCRFHTDVNRWYVDMWDRTADTYSFTNNLVHERVHAYGQVHVGQKQAPNACDMAYVAGDLAEVVLRSRAARGPFTLDFDVCPELLPHIRRAGLVQ